MARTRQSHRLARCPASHRYPLTCCRNSLLTQQVQGEMPFWYMCPCGTCALAVRVPSWYKNGRKHPKGTSYRSSFCIQAFSPSWATDFCFGKSRQNHGSHSAALWVPSIFRFITGAAELIRLTSDSHTPRAFSVTNRKISAAEKVTEPQPVRVFLHSRAMQFHTMCNAIIQRPIQGSSE